MSLGFLHMGRFCNGAAWLRLRGTAEGGCLPMSLVADAKVKNPTLSPKQRGTRWGTRLDWAVKLVVFVPL